MTSASTERSRDWPELLAHVADELGEGVALSLAQSFGGRELYLPRPETIDASHPIAVALGLGPARQLSELLRAGKIIVPLGPVNQMQRRAVMIRRLRTEGLTQARVAQRLGVHVETVRYRERRDRREASGREPDLFD